MGRGKAWPKAMGELVKARFAEGHGCKKVAKDLRLNISTLKKFTQAWSTLCSSPDTLASLRRHIAAWPQRLAACVQAGGGHFEGSAFIGMEAPEDDSAEDDDAEGGEESEYISSSEAE